MSPRSPDRRAALAACIAGLLSLAAAMGIGRFAFTPMLPLMVRAGQIDLGAGGWLAAANYVGYLLGAWTAARVPLSPSRLSALALLGIGAVTAAMALPLGLAGWWLLRLAAGVFSAWAFVGVSVWSLAVLAAHGRAAWAGWIYAGVGTGIAAAGLHCLVGGAAGLEAPALWMQLGLGAWLLAAVAALAGAAGSGTGPDKPLAPGASLTEAPLRMRGLLLCYGLAGFGYILPATFLPAMARQVLDDPAVFGLAWPLFGLTAALSTLLAAALLRSLPRVRVWAGCHALMAVGVLLPSLWRSTLTIAASALLVGGTFMVVTMAGMQEARARAGARATVMASRMTAAFALGQIAGPVLSALLLQWPALAANGLDLALQSAAVALLLSTPWLWRQL